MESQDGFRRRIAFSSKKNSSHRINTTNSPEKTQPNQRATPKKFNQIKSSPPKIGKQDQLFLKVVEEIQQRKCTFYRMGFKSYEKRDNRKVLGDVLGLDQNRMKGTMFTGELWSNRTQGRFLKENKIYMTKVKLLDKLQLLKKENEQAEKHGFDLDVEMESSKSLEDLHLPLPTTFRLSKRDSLKKVDVAESLSEIKSSLKQLKKESGIHSLINEIKYLQRCQEKLDKVERKYFLKMLELE